MQHRAAQCKALLPPSRKRAGDQILLAFEVRHFQRPFNSFFEFVRRHAVEAGEQANVFDHLEIVVGRKLLRHVTNILAHGFGFTAHVISSNLRAAGCGRE